MENFEKTIFTIARFLEKGNKNMFDVPIHEQYAYLNSLGDAKDDIDRSYKQFLCQYYFVPLWKKTLWFVVSVIAVPIAVLVFRIKGSFIDFERKIDTIAEKTGMDEIIPDELRERYDINNAVWNCGAGLINSDIKYLFKHIIGWKQPYFMLKMILLVAKYSPKVTKYHPNLIIEHSEYSLGSSAITDYLHSRGVKVINVQHGEKLRYIRDSFFHFDECYVWDKHYVDILTELKAEPTQFKIAVPPSLKIDIDKFRKVSAFADYKYYLAADNEQEIKSIVEAMSFAKREGKTVRYRIHPRYTDVNILRKYVPEDEVEYPKEVSIQESIANLEYAVGSYTTVLLQTHLSGKKVILNDVTFPKRYLQLKEYGYILANDKIDKLSDISRLESSKN